MIAAPTARSSNFYPRPPRGGRPRFVYLAVLAARFLSTPSARRATLKFVILAMVDSMISIHALREEGDRCRTQKQQCRRYFYPRPPRGGRRFPHRAAVTDKVFLSTPSARRATDLIHVETESEDISIHALREEGDDEIAEIFGGDADISIHALREEGDNRARPPPGKVVLFLSTPSARRATSASSTVSGFSCDFYPRPPRGGRPAAKRAKMELSNFYPRPPRGGRRLCRQYVGGGGGISIHALREEGDGGEAFSCQRCNISIHALREEGDTRRR